MPLSFKIARDPSGRVGDGATREFAACGGTIGRSPDNDWVLPDGNRYISGRHALLDFQAGAYYIVDTSRNGVYVNGADTPVGRGHPQRLFDGDTLRFGDIEIAVEISDDPPSTHDDGMRDSIVRAQLVPEDESMELAMLTEDKLVMDGSLARHLEPQEATAGSRKMEIVAEVKAPPQDALRDREAVNIMLKAAGLDVNAVTGLPPRQILEQTGTLLRALADGLVAMRARQRQCRAGLGLSNRTNESATKNPLDQAADGAESLVTLLNDRQDGFLPADDSIADVFASADTHEAALVQALRKALDDLLDRFDPAEIESRYDRAVPPRLWAKLNQLRYWEHYGELFAMLAMRNENRLPQTFAETLADAYSEECHARAGSKSRLPARAS